MRVTNGGKLPCKKIAHVASYDDDTKMKDKIKEVVAMCDDECCSSLAFPVTDTGGAGATKVAFDSAAVFICFITVRLGSAVVKAKGLSLVDRVRGFDPTFLQCV